MNLLDYRSLSGCRARWLPLLLLALAAVSVGGIAWWGIARVSATGVDPESQSYYTVTPMTLEVVIRKDGEIQAVTNTDIMCQVEGQGTIRTIVPEGTRVKKGDLLFELDSSEIRRKIQSARLDVQKAESDLTAAREQLHIQQSKNTADLEAANVELKLARLELQEYEEGKYPQQLSEATRGVQMAESAFKSKEQALAQTRSLFSKGFVTQAEVEKARLELVTATNELEKKTTELKVLRDFTHEKEIADKRNKLAQAEKKVARVQSENASNLAQRLAEAQTKEQALLIHRSALEHYEKQLANCTVYAPTDGIVVYGSSVSMYFREGPIQPGARIMEQQLVVRLPDAGALKAVTRIPEHQAVNLRVDEQHPMRASVRIVGLNESIPATVTKLSVMSDNMQRWWNPDLKEFPVDLTLDYTPSGILPGASCSVEIVVDRLVNVLAIPAAAICTWKDQSFVWVKNGNRLVQTRVGIGQSNVTHVQITEGLRPGQQVLMLQAGQGAQLLKLADDQLAPSTRPIEPDSSAQPTAAAGRR